jgi:hypothetical protein
VVVVVGMVVLIGVAAIGGKAWLGADPYPKGWEEQAIGEMGLSPDRLTLYVRGVEYQSRSCTEGRAEVTPGPELWTVKLEARKTKDFCTAEGCIVPNGDGRQPARILDAGETIPCPLAEVRLDEPVPDGIPVVPA